MLIKKFIVSSVVKFKTLLLISITNEFTKNHLEHFLIFLSFFYQSIKKIISMA